MSDSWSGRIDEIKARLKETVGGADGEVDVDSVMRGLREAVSQAGSNVDADALVARAREAVGAVEGKVDADKLKQWIDDVDTDKLRGWLTEGKTMAAGAAAAATAHGERLAEDAPGAFDKVVGAAKEKLGDLTGNEDLAREGELEQLKGEIKERYADASE
jgi:uncharacterized protein YjbJ (UPF0337 family)